MTNAATMRSYDDVPYLDLSYNLTHPGHLAVLATLLGMRPAPPTACRVLEIGCASGFNLVPMAYGLPGSQFVGIDISSAQIAAGQAAVAELGLRNIALRQMDLLDAGAELGEFDYIIAHGLYSWVEQPVQQRLLALCRRHLAPAGVAFISFNSQPGCRMFVALHEILRYHTAQISGERARATEALALLDALVAMRPGQNSPYDTFLLAAARLLRQKVASAGTDAISYLLHDELAQAYAPLFFYQFTEQAERHGLQYLADAAFPSAVAANQPPELAARFAELASDTVELEQYMDFVRNRSFRRTLLCRAEVALDRSLRPDPVAGLLVASSARPLAPAPDLRAGAPARFRSADGATLDSDRPVTKAAMLRLADAWPRPLPFAGLLAESCRAAGVGPAQRDDDARALAADLLRGFCSSMELVELHAFAPPIVAEVGDRPLASPVARLQARAGAFVTNLRHERVSFDAGGRALLRALDGTRDRAALLALLAEQGQMPGDGGGAALAQQLDQRLRAIARQALLVG